MRSLATGPVVLFAALLAGCNTLGLPGGPPDSAFVGSDLRRADDPVAAAEHARIVASYGGIYEDPAIAATLAIIVGRLVAASEDPDQPYRVTILNSSAVNAFALPGGFLYVTRGLLALANDASEVAAVVAHEMAHVTANHAAARQTRAQTAVIVGEAVNEAIDTAEATALAVAASQRSLASFSRQQELEADAIGVQTLARAGYDPFAASRFLRALAAYATYRASLGAAPDRRPEFMASHPSTPDRITAAENVARGLGVAGVTDQERYLSGINGLVFGDDSSQGYVRGRSYLHPGLGVGFTVPEGFLIDNTASAVLATNAAGVAMRFDAVNTSEPRLVDYLASGWINGLDPTSIREFQINAMPAASASAAAEDWVFNITVIAIPGGATYRFIFASEQRSAGFEAAAATTAASFRRLTVSEAAELAPLHLQIVPVRSGESQEALAARMRGVPEPLALFRALNNLRPGQILSAGSSVKIVTY
jgi:predicted Zn-dependent protease